MESINLYKQIVSHPQYSYCDETNSFNSVSYQSVAGNNYYIELRIVKEIIVRAEIGIGYKYKFINQLKFFSIKTKELLDSIEFHNRIYSRDFLIDQSVISLSKTLLSDKNVDNSTSRKETVSQVFHIVNTSFNTDQKSIAANLNIGQLVA